MSPLGIRVDLDRKRRVQAEAESLADPFIDREGYLVFIDRAELRFQEQLADQQGGG